MNDNVCGVAQDVQGIKQMLELGDHVPDHVKALPLDKQQEWAANVKKMIISFQTQIKADKGKARKAKVLDEYKQRLSKMTPLELEQLERIVEKKGSQLTQKEIEDLAKKEAEKQAAKDARQKAKAVSEAAKAARENAKKASQDLEDAENQMAKDLENAVDNIPKPNQASNYICGSFCFFLLWPCRRFEMEIFSHISTL